MEDAAHQMTQTSPRFANTRAVLTALWRDTLRHRWRSASALGLLVLAKLAGITVPLVLKAIVDRFSRPERLAASVGTALGAAAPELPHTVLVLPVFLLLAYALIRFSSTLFTELRDVVFSRVTQATVTRYAADTFSHFLALDPRFHVQRSTGMLTRDVERGIAGIGFLRGAGLFTVVPTLVEFAAVIAVMSAGYSERVQRQADLDDAAVHEHKIPDRHRPAAVLHSISARALRRWFFGCGDQRRFPGIVWPCRTPSLH